MGKIDCKGHKETLRGTGLSVMLLVLMVSEEQLNKDAIKRGGEKEMKITRSNKTIET